MAARQGDPDNQGGLLAAGGPASRRGSRTVATLVTRRRAVIERQEVLEDIKFPAVTIFQGRAAKLYLARRCMLSSPEHVVQKSSTVLTDVRYLFQSMSPALHSLHSKNRVQFVEFTLPSLLRMCRRVQWSTRQGRGRGRPLG